MSKSMQRIKERSREKPHHELMIKLLEERSFEQMLRTEFYAENYILGLIKFSENIWKIKPNAKANVIADEYRRRETMGLNPCVMRGLPDNSCMCPRCQMTRLALTFPKNRRRRYLKREPSSEP